MAEMPAFVLQPQAGPQVPTKLIVGCHQGLFSHFCAHSFGTKQIPVTYN